MPKSVKKVAYSAQHYVSAFTVTLEYTVSCYQWNKGNFLLNVA